MPDSTPEDPFADLYGKLPDPRARRIGDDARQPTPPTAEAGTAGGADVPLSRRAAREAARREGTRQAPVTPRASGTAGHNGGEAEVAHAPAPTDRPVPASGFPAVPLRATPTGDAARETADDEQWIFAGADAPRPAHYSRSTAPGMQASGADADDGDQPTARRSTATLEDLFTGDVPPPPSKRKRRLGGWIALGVVLVLLAGMAGGAWYAWTTYEDKIREIMGWEEPKDFAEGLANGEVFITIAPGDTGSPISQSLYDAGVTMTPEAFYDHLIEENLNPPFQPGVYRLQKQMTSAAALEALLDPANKAENTAQLPEGLTLNQTIERLAAGTGIPIEEFQAAVADPAAYGVAADSLEGWLFPATYTFDPGVTAQQIVQTLVDRAVQSLDAAGVPADDRHRIITIASIIQREARTEADMQKVSRVIQNRLDPANQETFGLLQMDSTAQYGFGEHDGTASSSAEALSDDNPWNTYVHAGLPIGPIANPGDVAIDAAMHPADGDWIYFVTVNLDTGETVFTSNLADHNRAVEQWQQWCSQNPDSGC
jgi:UPF0755 protein